MYNCRLTQKGRFAKALVMGTAIDIVRTNLEDWQKNKKDVEKKNVEKKKAQK
jgi:hypothetical protein